MPINTSAIESITEECGFKLNVSSAKGTKMTMDCLS